MPNADKDRIRILRNQKNEPGGSTTKRASEVNVSQLNDMEKRIISALVKQSSSPKADSQKDNHVGDAFGVEQSLKRTRFAEE